QGPREICRTSRLDKGRAAFMIRFLFSGLALAWLAVLVVVYLATGMWGLVVFVCLLLLLA
ncbi:hypothetical protein SOP94_27240, partial [Peribacillus frigoritolerans]|nr:hypothetical protein [Peribacillus frigoritolerans]